MAGPSPTERRLVRLAQAVRGLAALGPRTTLSALANTVRGVADGERVRRARLAERRRSIARGPGRLRSVEPLTDRRRRDGRPGRPVVVGALCRFEEADLEVVFLAPDLVRMSWGPDEPPLPWALAATTPGPAPRSEPEGVREPTFPVADVGESVTVTVTGDAAGCAVRSSALAVEISPDGTVVHRDARDAQPGRGAVRRVELPPIRFGDRRTHRHRLREGERVCGLGEHGFPLDVTGQELRLWAYDPGHSWRPGVDPLYCSIPALAGLHPDGDVLVFYENPADGEVRVGRDAGGAERSVEVTFRSGMLRHYLAAGPLPRLLDRYTRLTGRPRLPPRWALGYHQSRWGYRTSTEIEEVADGFARERLPLSAVHLDIDYMDGYRVFTVDRGRFPDLAGLCDRLARRGTRVVTIVDPAVKEDPHFELYRQGMAQGHFVRRSDGGVVVGVVWPGRATYPDFTDPGTRRWWGGWYGRLLDAGVAGVWHDMNEPTSMSLVGDRTLPADAHHTAEGVGARHDECHNVYGLLMDRAGSDALALARPDRRPWVLSRSGWAGVQRWAWMWTGDIESTWDGLRQQVPSLLSLALSGVAFAGSDTGGFAGSPSPELYVRWLELSVTTPLCRTHCSTSAARREPWCFDEPYRTAIGRLVRFRYRLLPYLYTVAYDAATTGHPPLRPLCWPGPGNDRAASPMWSDDAYFLGDVLLVAPVFSPGARSRRMVVPAGTWYRWRPLGAAEPPSDAGPGSGALRGPGDEAVEAAEVVEADGLRPHEFDAPLGSPVLLVRAGSILPLDDGWGEAAATSGPDAADDATDRDEADEPALDPGHRPRRLAFHCFPDPRTRSAVGAAYDDAGDGAGPSRRDELALEPNGGKGGNGGDAADGLVLRWTRRGRYRPPRALRVVVYGIAASIAVADGAPVEVRVLRDAAGVTRSEVECGPFRRLELR